MMFPIISTWSCPTSRHLRVALFVLGHVVAWGLCAVDTVMMPPHAICKWRSFTICRFCPVLNTSFQLWFVHPQFCSINRTTERPLSTLWPSDSHLVLKFHCLETAFKSVASRACCKLLEQVKSVASRGCYKLIEQVESLATRKCYKLPEQVKKSSIKSVLHVTWTG